MRIAILGSGRGSNAKAILEAQASGKLGRAVVVGVISDIENAPILELNKKFNVTTHFIPPGAFKTKLEGDAEQNYLNTLAEWGAEWIVLAGFMRMLKEKFLNTYRDRIINIHPSLLPAFKGLNAIQQAWNYGVKVAGCTVHYVNAQMDDGAIIDQATVRIEKEDTLESLEKKVHDAEHLLLSSVIERLSLQS